MPHAVFRSPTGIYSSADSRPGRAASRRAVLARVAAEALEERRLFALAVAPLPAGTLATTLGASLLVPNTGITITGGTYVGVNNQGGTFTGLNFPTIQDGVLLTTGTASDAVGPNDQPLTTTAWLTPGDPDLNVLTNLTTQDANSLTLNFTAALGTQSILFDFIFASEEFPEFNGSIFSDGFGAYLDGVQVSTDINGRPISLNNNFFNINNLTGALPDVEYDGLTPRIRTRAPLNATITNHTLKFVVADTVNADWDTAAFISRLQGSTAAAVAPSTNLPDSGTIFFSTTSYTADETAGTASILLERRGGTSGQVTVNYIMVGDTATDLLDFTGTAGTVTFADGQATQTITVPILDDPAAEGDETVLVAVNTPVDANIGFPDTVTLTILDNEKAITFIPARLSIPETVGAATLVVSRSGLINEAATVSYATRPDATAGASTATDSADYLSASGTINFAPGQRIAIVTVPIVGDFTDGEANETFQVALSSPIGAPLGVLNVATVTIRDVDRPPSIYDITAHAPAGRIEALFLKLNDPVLAERAIDPATYDLYQHTERRFNGSPSRRRVGVRAVDYNPGLRTLVIHPARPLKNNVFYEVTVRGTTDNGLLGNNAERLDGNLDRFAGSEGEDFVGYFGRGTRLTYNDRDGTKVKLGATGGGVIEVFRDASRDARTVRYLGGTAASSIFGIVTPTWKGSDRATDIGTLILGGAQNFLSNPPFRVGAAIQ